jgi:Arc/MetJ family transcription regulator
MLCHTYGMRTTLDLDDHLMESLMARHPGASKTKAVEAAIEDHVRRGAADRLLRMRGRLDIEDVSKEMRALDRLI